MDDTSVDKKMSQTLVTGNNTCRYPMIHVKDELLANYIQRFLQMPQYGVNT